MAAFLPTAFDQTPIVAGDVGAAAVIEGAPIVAPPAIVQSAPTVSPYNLTPLTGAYSGFGGFGGFGDLSSFGGFNGLGYGGYNGVNAYSTGVQSAGLLGPIVGPYPAATTFTGLAPTATSSVNLHNYAGYGYNRPIAYGYENATLGGPYPRGVPAVNPIPPYAAVGARTPVPPVGSYGVARGRFHKGSKRIAGTGANAGERYYYG